MKYIAGFITGCLITHVGFLTVLNWIAVFVNNIKELF